MLAYRIVNKKYANDLSGTGAAIFGGRWNKKGTAVLYVSETIELALLETIVNIPPMLIPSLDLLILEVPDNSITEIKISKLPANWKSYPAPTILSEIGEDWVKDGKNIALKVPSCIIETSHNFILNCRHSEYSKIKLIEQRDFEFDSRLKKY